MKWIWGNSGGSKEKQREKDEELKERHRRKTLDLKARLYHADKSRKTLEQENVALNAKVLRLELKYRHLMVRSFLVIVIMSAVMHYGSARNLWNAMLNSFHQLSSKSAEIHTMFGNSVELKYTARALALAMFLLLLFVIWPLVRIVRIVIEFVAAKGLRIEEGLLSDMESGGEAEL
eukprot:g5167.t1